MTGYPFNDTPISAIEWTEIANSPRDYFADLDIEYVGDNTLIIKEGSKMKLAAHYINFDNDYTIYFPANNPSALFTVYLEIDVINQAYTIIVDDAYTGDNGNLSTLYKVYFMTYTHPGGPVLIVDDTNITLPYHWDWEDITENTIYNTINSLDISHSINDLLSNDITLALTIVDLQETLNRGSSAFVSKNVYFAGSGSGGYEPINGFGGTHMFIPASSTDMDINKINSSECQLGIKISSTATAYAGIDHLNFGSANPISASLNFPSTGSGYTSVLGDSSAYFYVKGSLVQSPNSNTIIATVSNYFRDIITREISILEKLKDDELNKFILDKLKEKLKEKEKTWQMNMK